MDTEMIIIWVIGFFAFAIAITALLLYIFEHHGRSDGRPHYGDVTIISGDVADAENVKVGTVINGRKMLRDDVIMHHNPATGVLRSYVVGGGGSTRDVRFGNGVREVTTHLGTIDGGAVRIKGRMDADVLVAGIPQVRAGALQISVGANDLRLRLAQ